MKKIFLFALAALTLGACAPKQEQALAHPDFAYTATMYELNTRQFTPEGTFAAAEAELPALAELGVDIIWIMPLQPIGELERKGTLGSYYAIKDYCAFNPEFGTRADFESFLNKAHELGIRVILDWVANHTAPDHPWTQNEGWHYRDSLGNLKVQYDWTDIAELNYENQDMRNAMLAAMKWWADTIGIDGFRCDVAMEVPTDFWEWAYRDIRTNHPDFLSLSEAELPELNVEAFDLYYGWELHHHMNAVAQGKEGVEDLWKYFAKADTAFVPEAIRLNFTSNHDENSWAGTEYERMGDAVEAFAAFTYVVPGIPLIYTGQEYGNNHRLLFFEKDLIDRVNTKMYKVYQDLDAFRTANSALWAPELGAPMARIACDNDKIFACVRANEENTVLGIFNFSGEEQKVILHTADYVGDYTCICGAAITVEEEDEITLKPWEYVIYAK